MATVSRGAALRATGGPGGGRRLRRGFARGRRRDHDGRLRRRPFLAEHPLLQRPEREARDRLQRLEDPLSEDCARLVALVSAVLVQVGLELLDGEDARQVPLVVLESEGDFVQVQPDLGQVGAEVREAFEVGLPHRALRVRDEDDAVHSLEDELAGRVVEDLPGDGVELDARLEPADHPDVERKEIEEERAIGLGLERDHLPPRVRERFGRKCGADWSSFRTDQDRSTRSWPPSASWRS